MPLRMTSDRAHERTLGRLRARLGSLLPATRQVGEWVAREARRRAPVGYGSGALKRSLTHREPNDAETTLISPLPYALAQQFGANIRGGGAHSRIQPKPKMLAIPLSLEARRLSEMLGAAQSLRRIPGLEMFESRTGRMFLVRHLDQADKGKRGFKKYRGRSFATRVIRGRMEFLFILLPAVKLQANPAPRGYAPRGEEPEFRVAVGRILRRFLRGVA